MYVYASGGIAAVGIVLGSSKAYETILRLVRYKHDGLYMRERWWLVNQPRVIGARSGTECRFGFR